MSKPLKIALGVVYVLFLVGVSAKLFFEEGYNRLVLRFTSGSDTTVHALTIAYPDSVVRLDPLANDVGSRARLLHIYEPLLKTDADLTIHPALALSYGALNDTTWEVRIRTGVVFHDGTPLTVDDVVASLTRAQTDLTSDLRDVLATISIVKKIDKDVIHIVTIGPDPLLPQKLTLVLVSPAQSNGNKIGTGPYRLVSSEGGAIQLERFDTYWSSKPAFQSVTLQTAPTRDAKNELLKNRSADIIGGISADVGEVFAVAEMRLETVPGLEVNFLGFSLRGQLAGAATRTALKQALNTEALSRLGHGFSKAATQFVSKGIFGYDPTLKDLPYNPTASAAYFQEHPLTTPLTFSLPTGLETLGKAVVEQLAKVGVSAELTLLAPNDLADSILKGTTTDLYFFAWRSDLGDASDFLQAVAHSRAGSFGQFNGGNYFNSSADEEIEKSLVTIAPKDRLELLRKVMKIVTLEDPLGIPLFSQEALYAVSDSVRWQPRVDGMILAQEAKIW